MRNIVISFFVIIYLLSCSNKSAKKPNNLISLKTMEEVIYDVYMLNAIKISNKKLLQNEEVSFEKEIFEKYNIDSLQFAKSNDFYAADFETYKALIERIKKRMDSNKKALEQLIEEEKKSKKD
jgi:hypothetical protein